MYLTKFPINMTRRETRRMLASPYRIHAALSGSFSGHDSSENGEGRLLWRVDRETDGSTNLFIVSPQIPSLAGLNEQIGWPDLDRQWQTRSYDGFLSQIDVGQVYGFRLCANPVVSRTSIKNSHGNSKRVAHLTPLQQMAWLVGEAVYQEAGVEASDYIMKESETRAARNGFEVEHGSDGSLQLAISEISKRVFRQGIMGRTITLATARYDGILKVTDSEKMRHALTRGIGHGKGFGCGLLTLASVSVR